MYPTTYDTFIAIKKYGATITESVTIPTSAVPVAVTVTYPILSSVSMPGFTEVANGIVPITGKFRVFYKTKTIEFGPIASPTTITGSYQTWGTLIGDLPIQGMINSTVAIETVLGLQPQGSYGTVAERLTALDSGSAHSHKRVDLSTQITGMNNVFILPTAPTQVEAFQVFYNGMEAEQDADYIVDGTNLVFVNTTPSGDPNFPQVGDTLIAYYIFL